MAVGGGMALSSGVGSGLSGVAAWLDGVLRGGEAARLRRINTNGDSKLWSQKRLKLINQANISSTHFYSLHNGFSTSLLSSLCLHGSHAHMLYRQRTIDASSACGKRESSDSATDRRKKCS
jgi:hypothetical protein